MQVLRTFYFHDTISQTINCPIWKCVQDQVQPYDLENKICNVLVGHKPNVKSWSCRLNDRYHRHFEYHDIKYMQVPLCALQM